jgi:hypothetical protein
MRLTAEFVRGRELVALHEVWSKLLPSYAVFGLPGLTLFGGAG